MAFDIIFPPSDGLILAALRVGLATNWSTGLTVQTKLPETRTRRMVTLRSDSGPQEQTQSRRRYGVNVWADSAVDAEKIALESMAILRKFPDGQPVTATDSFAGPFEVDDDPVMAVGNKNLSHFYFTVRVSVRGSSF